MNLESLAQSLEKFNKLLPLLGLIFSALVLLAGSMIYDINPFHMLKRIVAEQQGFDHAEQQRQFQRTVVENHVALGNAFLDDRLYKQASEEFDKALAIDKLNVNAQIGHFIVETAQQIENRNDFRPQAIQRQLDFLQQQQPGNPYVQVLYGDLSVQLEDYPKAKAHYDRAIQSEQQPASAYFGLGYWHETQGQWEQAQSHYEIAAKRSPWNQSYLNNLATVSRKLGRYEESIEHYKKILTLDRDYLLAHLGVAHSYTYAGKPKMAMHYLQQMLEFMEQPAVNNHSKNKTAWSFHDVLLETPDEKRQYALHHLAFAFFLLDRKDDAQRTLQTAQAIKTRIGAEIKATAAQDIAHFIRKNPRYEAQARQFKTLYLK